MNLLRRVGAIALLALGLGSPGSADAATWGPIKLKPGPSLEQSVRIGEQWVRSLGLVNTCAGRLRIDWEVNPQDHDGQIDGYTDAWSWNGIGWDWDRTRCRIVVRSGMSATKTCGLIGHELVHAVRGPEHDRLLKANGTPPACDKRVRVRGR